MKITNKKLIDLITVISLRYPHLRFCQIIQNCFDKDDIYYKTNDELYVKLIEVYKQ